ncbi:MAG: PEPxxWA-CTERM sorting domain-containing protein [Caulobacteraceae bacterium]
MTSIRGLFAGALVAGAALVASSAMAATNLVANPSFEILPAGGLPIGCGTDCAYSVGPVPDWTTVGTAETGQFQPGPPANTTYFNSVPDGVTVGYSNGAELTQTVGPTAVGGATYTLTLEQGFRKDVPDPATDALMIGSTVIAALPTTTPVPLSGDWFTYTASFTATPAMDGEPISVILDSNGVQGDWDAVSLVSSVPEPASWALMLVGFGALGWALRGRRRTAPFAV